MRDMQSLHTLGSIVALRWLPLCVALLGTPIAACADPPPAAPLAGARAASALVDDCGEIDAQAAYRCTEVIGYSQVHNWWGTGAAPIFEASAGIDATRWQLRWRNGATLERWAEPGFAGWAAGNVVSPCADPTIERVVLALGSSVLDEHSPLADWVAAIEAALATVRAKRPALRTIVLQPIIGGTPTMPCATQASRSHPVQVAAAALVADGVEVLEGAAIQVESCAAFADALGHLTAEGSRRVGAKVAVCYAR